jgi:transcriptional regulator with XRE-family HTH domain
MARQETIKRKKDYAKLLYTVQGVTVQKELAQRSGVSEQTISKWVRTEKWEQIRASVIITKEEELKRLYYQVTELNDAIAQREQGYRYANTKEADVLVKLTAAIRQMETDTSLADSIDVLKDFINHVRQEDFEMAKKITTLADGFIKTLVK